MLPALLISLLWYFVGQILPMFVSAFLVIFLVLFTGVLLQVRSSITSPDSSKTAVLSLLLLTVLFIVLRLAFVTKALLPLYFDSAQHYLFIKTILANLNHAGATVPLTSYYHLGFHFLAAFITFMTRAQINEIMLVLGQVILAVMPFSAFFIIRHWTQSNTAGIFALFLAAFGWYMPAHAMDWGKYPALASIAVIPFVLSNASLSFQGREFLSPAKYWGLNIILLTGMILSVFLHSRTFVVFGILVFTWMLVFVWQKLPRIAKLVVLGLAILALIYEINFIQTDGALTLVFDPYGPKGYIITAAILFLSIFAYLRNPAVVVSCIVSIVLLIASLFIPLGTLIPGYANTTLLDRPFVEMILYLPLTLLGGFGLASLEQILQDQKIARKNTFRKIVSAFFFTLVIINAWFQYDFYPADCCDIASQDDLAAIQWADRNLPRDARILISSTELNVLPTDEYQGSAGGDAGTWIHPLINRFTIYMPYNTDFSQQQTLDTICQLHADYIYVGKTGSGFNEVGMSTLPQVYKAIFVLPNARIYEVAGCD
jgi:hypothetical protein